MDSDFMLHKNYAESSQMGVAVRAPTMKERLEFAVKDAEQRLTEAKRAKEIFEKHPELEELLNIMQKGRF